MLLRGTARIKNSINSIFFNIASTNQTTEFVSRNVFASTSTVVASDYLIAPLKHEDSV